MGENGVSEAIIAAGYTFKYYSEGPKHVHKAVGILKDHKKPIADFLVKKIAKPTKDAATEGAVSAVFMVFCFHLAGFPKGSISCVAGKGSEIRSFLTMHPRVNCIRVE